MDAVVRDILRIEDDGRYVFVKETHGTMRPVIPELTMQLRATVIAEEIVADFKERNAQAVELNVADTIDLQDYMTGKGVDWEHLSRTRAPGPWSSSRGPGATRRTSSPSSRRASTTATRTRPRWRAGCSTSRRSRAASGKSRASWSGTRRSWGSRSYALFRNLPVASMAGRSVIDARQLRAMPTTDARPIERTPG